MRADAGEEMRAWRCTSAAIAASLSKTLPCDRPELPLAEPSPALRLNRPGRCGGVLRSLAAAGASAAGSRVTRTDLPRPSGGGVSMRTDLPRPAAESLVRSSGSPGGEGGGVGSGGEGGGDEGGGEESKLRWRGAGGGAVRR